MQRFAEVVCLDGLGHLLLLLLQIDIAYYLEQFSKALGLVHLDEVETLNKGLLMSDRQESREALAVWVNTDAS